MTITVSIADFRNGMRKMLESALSGREVICVDAKSKDRVECSFIKTKLFRDILAAYSFSPKIFYDEETKTHNFHLDELRLYAYADTLQEAVEQMIDMIIEYVKDYINRLELFLNIPDRKSQYPYVLRLSHCLNRDEIKEMIVGSI